MITSISAKRILVYGDSYVFGVIPGGNGARYDASTRYTGVAQNYLGSDYDILEAGLRGRTISGENGYFPHRNGLMQFDGIIGSHLPLDLVCLALGTNDTNSSRDQSPQVMVEGYIKYLRSISWWAKHLGFPKPRIALIAPPEINEPDSIKVFKNIFNGSSPKIIEFRTLLKDFATENKVLFFDAGAHCAVSPLDGVHLDIENNRLLGRAFAQFIKEVL